MYNQIQMPNNKYFENLTGQTMCLTDWAKITGIPNATLRYRIRARWDLAVAFSKVPMLGNNRH